MRLSDAGLCVSLVCAFVSTGVYGDAGEMVISQSEVHLNAIFGKGKGCLSTDSRMRLRVEASSVTQNNATTGAKRDRVREEGRTSAMFVLEILVL